MSVMPGYPLPRSQWATSGEACTACRKRFSFFTAKENCPCCGRLFCSSCLSAECTLTPMGLPSAICLECFQKIQDWRRVQREQQRQEALQSTTSSAAASPSPPAAEARLTSLETQFGRLQQSGRQLREESDSIMSLLVAKDKTIAELTEQQQRSTAEKESATRISEEARQQVRVLAAARDEATQALREVQEKLSVSQETGASMAEKMDALLEANAILKSRITKLQSESAEWQRRCDVANAAAAQSHKEAEDAQTALRSAAKELAEARREKENLRTATEAFTAERRAQEAEVARLKSILVETERQTRLQQEKLGDDAAASRDAAAARTAEQQQRMLELTEEGKTLRATMKRLEAQLKEAEQRSAQEHKARTDAESRVAAMVQELTEYEKKENAWASLQKAHEEAMQNLRTAAERASHEAAVTHQQLLKSVEDSENNTAALLSEKQGTIDSLTRELRAAQDGLEALQSQVSAAQQSAGALRDELRRAEDAAEAKVSAAVATAVAERDAARALLAQREEEVAGLTERLSSAAAAAAPSSPAAAVEAAGPLDRTSRWRRPTRVAALRYTPSQLVGAERGIPAVAGLERWEFDTKAEAARVDVPDALVRIGYQIALDWLLFPSTDALQRWVRMLDVVQHNYYPNPYHNKEHAADILQGVYALVLQCPGLLANMTKMEKRAVVFAAAVHDVRHPGRTEAFLKNTFDPTYFAYNGCRVLEQMHTATAFQLLGHADLDFTQDDMDDTEVLRFHELVASLIAVTYMGSHATLMQTWSRPLREGGGYDMSKAGDRHTVLGMLLHAADIGAQSRGIDVAVKWLGVVDEMYEQGDEEAALGLPVGPGNSRSGDVKRGQIFFMEMFVIPLFDLVHQLFPAIEAPLRHLRTLHAHYSAATEQPQRPFPPPVAYAADAEQQRAAAAEEEQRRSALATREAQLTAELSEKQSTIDSLTRELRAAQDGLEALQSQVSAAQQSAGALRDELRRAEDAAEAKVSAAVATAAAERDAARALLAQREEEVAGLTERLSSAAAAAAPASPAAAVEAAGPLDRTSRWRRPTRVAALRYTPSQLGGAERGIPAVAGLDRWEFDTKAEAARADVPDALVRIGYQIALDWLLFPSTDALQRWVRMLDVVQHNYYPNPYHNKEHAADILQGVYALVLQCPGLLANMTKMEKRAVVFAAAVHDVRHPGRTEAFLKNTFDPTYFAYNGCRVLEQMHTATAFQLLGHADLDFTQDDMDDTEVLRFHELVASLIAVTYMGSHATLMQTWSRPLREGGGYDMSKAGDRHTVLGMLLHAADIGAQSRGIDVAVKWLGVVDEMYEQGDEEAALGLPVGPGNSRSGDVKRGQIFFMEMFVIPLFDLVHQLFPAIEAPLRHLRTLHAHYSAATEQPQRPFPPPVAYAADAEQQRAAAAEEEQRRSALVTREAQLTRKEKAVEQAVERLRQATATVAQRETQLSEREAQLTARLSEPGAGASGADTRDDSRRTEQELHRAAAAVVEREAAVQKKAAELEAVTAELEQREAVTSQLSSQLATIAERVNRRRQTLRYREAQVRAREAAIAAAAFGRGSEEEESREIGTTAARHNGESKTTRETSPQPPLAAGRTAELAKLKSALEKLSSAMSFM